MRTPLLLLSILGTGLGACGAANDPAPNDAPPKSAALVLTDASPGCVNVPAKARWRAESSPAGAGGAFDGVAVGALGYTPGVHGLAFQLDGQSAAVTVDDGEQLWSSRSFSVEAWVKTTQHGVVLSKYECGGTCYGQSYWSLSIGYDGAPRFLVRPSTSKHGFAITANRSVTDDAWHHLVGVRDLDGGQLRLYIDGALSVAWDFPRFDFGPLRDTDGEVDPVVIGAVAQAGAPGVTDYFTGAIDDAAYYDRALSALEVWQLDVAPDGACD